MKYQYSTPSAEIYPMSAADIITASPSSDENGGIKLPPIVFD